MEKIKVFVVTGLNGKVYKEFPSRNQANKFKRQCLDGGIYCLKIIEKEIEVKANER